MQKIEGRMRRAIEDYDMIEEGDKIAIALSGGKDSATLLYELKIYQDTIQKSLKYVQFL